MLLEEVWKLPNVERDCLGQCPAEEEGSGASASGRWLTKCQFEYCWGTALCQRQPWILDPVGNGSFVLGSRLTARQSGLTGSPARARLAPLSGPGDG